MIEVANENATNKKLDNITFLQTTVFDAKFSESTYNVVLSYNILLYFEDFDKKVSNNKYFIFLLLFYWYLSSCTNQNF